MTANVVALSYTQDTFLGKYKYRTAEWLPSLATYTVANMHDL